MRLNMAAPVLFGVYALRMVFFDNSVISAVVRWRSGCRALSRARCCTAFGSSMERLFPYYAAGWSLSLHSRLRLWFFWQGRLPRSKCVVDFALFSSSTGFVGKALVSFLTRPLLSRCKRPCPNAVPSGGGQVRLFRVSRLSFLASAAI